MGFADIDESGFLTDIDFPLTYATTLPNFWRQSIVIKI